MPGAVLLISHRYKGVIPEPLRAPIGNRIYGCDDCQLVCPWNRFAKVTGEPDFHARHGLHNSHLLTLFAWTKKDFLHYTEGSALRRLGYECWQRNLAVALGNAPYDPDIITALKAKQQTTTTLVAEHIVWAISQQTARS